MKERFKSQLVFQSRRRGGAPQGDFWGFPPQKEPQVGLVVLRSENSGWEFLTEGFLSQLPREGASPKKRPKRYFRDNYSRGVFQLGTDCTNHTSPKPAGGPSRPGSVRFRKWNCIKRGSAPLKKTFWRGKLNTGEKTNIGPGGSQNGGGEKHLTGKGLSRFSGGKFFQGGSVCLCRRNPKHKLGGEQFLQKSPSRKGGGEKVLEGKIVFFLEKLFSQRVD